MGRPELQAARAPHYLRHQPRQQRSQILFRKILATAKRLFEELGYLHVSTNHIAAAANISIGSVYKYFSNCESIALTLYEESSARATLLATRKSLEAQLPLDKAIPDILSALISIFDSDRYVLLHLINEVPELRGRAQALSFDNLTKRATRTFLQQHFPLARDKDIERKAYVLARCIIGIVSDYLSERPGIMTDKAMVSELSLLVRLYLEATLAVRKSYPSCRHRPSPSRCGE